MKLDLVKKAKIFLIVAVVLLVAGMAIFGVFGMNQPIDNKTAYEMQISVDQTAEEAVTTMRTSADEYFADAKISPVSYSVQELDEGAKIIYKFNENVSDSVEDVKEYVGKALEKANIANVGVTVLVQEVHGSYQSQIGWIALALGIAVVVAFVYVLIMEKLAAALATAFSSVLAVMLFIAVTALSRIPTGNAIAFGAGVAGVIASVLSVATLNKYREEIKNAEGKVDCSEVIDKVACAEILRYAFVLGAILISAVLIGVLGWIYVGFTAVQLAIAGIVSTVTTFFAIPFMWKLIKDSNNK